MSDKICIVIPIPPSINNDYVKPRAIMNRGKPMAMMYETKLAKDFKKDMIEIIAQEVKSQEFKLQHDKYTRINWTWYFARSNQDTNNYYKCAIDSLTESGLVWKDDNISLNKDSRIYYDSSNPRVELEIYYEDWIGIFDSNDELEEFKINNCNQCKKGNKIGQKGGCSIYSKILENKISSDIQRDIDGLWQCAKTKENK